MNKPCVKTDHCSAEIFWNDRPDQVKAYNHTFYDDADSLAVYSSDCYESEAEALADFRIDIHEELCDVFYPIAELIEADELDRIVDDLCLPGTLMIQQAWIMKENLQNDSI